MGMTLAPSAWQDHGMRVLVTGADGPLGHAVCAAFRDDTLVALSRAELDVTREPDVVAAVRDHRPDLVVHAAGLGTEEQDRDAAWEVGAGGAWWVARACDLAGAAMVQLSTAEVFDGLAGRPYTEFDVAHPQTTVGCALAAAEQLVRETLRAHYVVRLGRVVGPDSGLVERLRQAAQDGSPVHAADHQVWSVALTFDVLPILRALAVSGRFGTYHLSNAGHCTEFEFARALVAALGWDLDVVPAPAAAGGCLFRVLDHRMAALAGLRPLPQWQASLSRLAGMVR